MAATSHNAQEFFENILHILRDEHPTLQRLLVSQGAEDDLMNARPTIQLGHQDVEELEPLEDYLDEPTCMEAAQHARTLLSAGGEWRFSAETRWDNMATFVAFCRYQDACREALTWLEQQSTPQQAWENCPRLDWALWLVKHTIEDAAPSMKCRRVMLKALHKLDGLLPSTRPVQRVLEIMAHAPLTNFTAEYPEDHGYSMGLCEIPDGAGRHARQALRWALMDRTTMGMRWMLQSVWDALRVGDGAETAEATLLSILRSEFATVPKR